MALARLRGQAPHELAGFGDLAELASLQFDATMLRKTEVHLAAQFESDARMLGDRDMLGVGKLLMALFRLNSKA